MGRIIPRGFNQIQSALSETLCVWWMDESSCSWFQYRGKNAAVTQSDIQDKKKLSDYLSNDKKAGTFNGRLSCQDKLDKRNTASHWSCRRFSLRSFHSVIQLSLSETAIKEWKGSNLIFDWSKYEAIFFLIVKRKERNMKSASWRGSTWFSGEILTPITEVGSVQQLYLEGLLGEGVVLVPTRPRLPVFGVETVSEHVDVEEDELLVRKILPPKLNHQLPEDVGWAADKHHCKTEETGSDVSGGSSSCRSTFVVSDLNVLMQ